MITGRGWAVVAIFTAVSLMAGLNAGTFRRDLMWQADWTRLTVAAEGKGDKYGSH